MTRASLALAMLAISCVSASSAESVTADSITQSGYGKETCMKWTELHHAVGTPESIASDHWILGYLDGLAKFTNDERREKGLTSTDMLQGLKAPILTLMEDYCRGNTGRTIQEAISALSAQMIATEPHKNPAPNAITKVSGYG